ncbi:tyrosine-protein kinase transmembrane receptor Ror2 [Neodiprion pinetum]|uniref:receptor protein-tyrosine kinase n=2 Tax=Neodiprion lecontei TaxID=441921 RepID=A0A6J0C269_NEOLC|nr:tyrosine-protein kinase transmembrane receptor Ror2 isoform X1 [Neodiprion lecontei]XP_046479326.1 tyrosine-protein kinase transmembrane receptor Ror2 isoform X1 [Neodiprion pinetum]XP_046479327.1 tyrosine-protein kinase transmembrane receptor Ror2 isoform X1 [Neodiprion pinetum]XP_046479328.1 tyrosine-protein kinase transmembrane receptor Ror2 isoform X1 [Neodiprion pinetum]XP_046479329.1 tyrosine-protein kinase transmembrane receptor Ror2 isoform X1 [Neodiprion pinetum]XP_046479330.1 tyro
MVFLQIFCFFITLQLSSAENNSSMKGYCAPYNGKICKKYLTGIGQVWFNDSDGNNGGWLNEKITTGLWTDLIKTLIEPCRSAAEKLLCMYAFPQCVDSVGLPLCYEDCMAVRQQFCLVNWAMIEEHKKRASYIRSRGHFTLPDCESLPRISKGPQTCSNASLTDMNTELITRDCVIGNGRFYLGFVNKTKSGLDCQSWAIQEPHSHDRPPDVFPQLQNAENYCRNAGGDEPMPWCYTMDPNVRWELCDIPICANSTEVTMEIDLEDLTMEAFFTPRLILILSSIGFVCILVLLLSILLCQRLQKQHHGYNPTETQEVNIDLDKLPSNDAYHHTGAQLNPKLEKLEFPRNNIIYVRDLGQGAFGRVFQAKAPGLVSEEEFTNVAVKMLKDEASDDLLVDFEREACLLAEFDHPNIVKLLGVCAIGRPMCLLFEYMGRGDLNEFLRSCSPGNYIVRSIENDSFRDMRLSHMNLIMIAIQVASGMVYLSDRKFVHRDLATRNCLINDQMVVKIADFGLSQKIYLQDYYKGDEQDAIPVRWMPLESILYNKYTIETDIWAFAVCLWEIFSFALQPYYGMTHEEVVKYIKDGHVLQCPDNTPQPIYELMKLCWNKKPSDRPTFRMIYQTLSGIKHDMEIPNDKCGSNSLDNNV